MLGHRLVFRKQVDLKWFDVMGDLPVKQNTD